jgi:hypothetical protein
MLQLQQTIGNRAVAGMIQRHQDSVMNKFGFKVVDNETGEESTLFTPTGESQERQRGASDVLNSGEQLAGDNQEEDIYEE